jgi:PAS domain S-box-containing protein
MNPFKVLLLEDADHDAELIKYELCKARIPVIIERVENRESFIRALNEFLPDLILADYRLPTFDGATALALTQEICPEVPFIFVSGVMSEEMAQVGLKSGAKGFVFKDDLGSLASEVKSSLTEINRRRPGNLSQLFAGSLIACLSPDHCIVEFEGGAERLTGWRRHEVLGRDAVELLVPPPKRPWLRAKFSELLSGKPVKPFNLKLLLRRGGQRLFRLSLALLHNLTNQPAGIMVVGQKVAEGQEPRGTPETPEKRPPLGRRDFGRA